MADPEIAPDPNEVPLTPPGKQWPPGATVLCNCGEYVGNGRGLHGHRSAGRAECQEPPTTLAPSQVADAKQAASTLARDRQRDAAKAAKPTNTPGARVEASVLLPPDPPPSAYGAAPIPIPGGKVLLFQHTVRLRGKTWTTYEVACNDAELAFDGSFDEFLDECVEAFFQSLGYLGVGLVRAAQPQQVAS